MKINEQKGTVVFNTAELDKNTMEICKLYIADTLKRFLLTENARTKAQTERNRQQNIGLRIAVNHLEALQHHAEKNLGDIEIWK